MADLPTGTVTFLFTDIEGSTRLLDELGDAYAEVLAEHHRLMRESFEPCGGVEVDTAGDAFFVAFERVSDALASAAAAQEALEPLGLRVRMGIHTGQPLVTTTGYVGMDVHKAARVMSAGHGGQVLVSDATRALLDGNIGLTDLGQHRLKDLTEPQRLWQLGEAEFPPLKTLYQTNLPIQPTPLVGREAELAEVMRLLRESRLVTLTGAGGSGKTRLALQAAAELVDEYKDGAWWVSLAALRDPDLVEPTIAQVVGAKNGLAEHLRTKQALLLLDNFEHLLAAAPLVSAVLAEASEIRVLTTSRERLALAAEHEYVVPTMEESEAVALFTTRARQVRPTFEPDDAAAEICRRLDGLPLAIELAAARIKVLRSEQILERLVHSLELLTVGRRDAPERQQTLRATIEWSYALLGGAEKELMARLAVFGGSFSVEAAEEICEADFDALAGLVDKSLLRQTDEGRFFLLETVKEFAEECLEESAAAEAVRAAHARLILSLAERARDSFEKKEHAQLLEEIGRERDNVRAALTWLGSTGRHADTLRVIAGVFEFWLVRGSWSEGLRWAEEALSRPVEQATEDLAIVMYCAGAFAACLGNREAAKGYMAEGVAVARKSGNQDVVSRGLTNLGILEAQLEDYAAATRWFEEALDDSEGVTAFSRAAALESLGNVAVQEGDYERAAPLLTEALEIYRKIENENSIGSTLGSLAFCLLQLRRDDEALVAVREAVVRSRTVGDVVVLIHLFTLLAAIAASHGDSRAAAVLLGLAGALLDQTAFSYGGAEAELYSTTSDAVARALGETAYKHEHARGEAMELGEAVDYALAALD